MPNQPSPYTLRETGSNSPEWSFRLDDSGIHLVCESLNLTDFVSREQMPEQIELRDTRSQPRMLIYKSRAGIRVFRLDPEIWEAVSTWHGPLTARHLAVALRRMTRFGVVIGIVLIFLSLSWGGNPDAEVPSIPMDPTGLALGIGLLSLGLAARTVPHRVLFGGAMLWWIILGAVFVGRIAEGASMWWLIWVFFCLVFARSAWEQLKRFAPANMVESP